MSAAFYLGALDVLCLITCVVCAAFSLRAAIFARTLHPPCPRARVLYHPCGEPSCSSCASHPAAKRKARS